MNPKIKNYLIIFITGGLIFALLDWAIDFGGGGGFDLVKFITRFFLFGFVMTLALSIGSGKGEKKKIV